ncbi:hypothetical protein MTR67_016527 [Solanum verrucosum]|uniref:Uncharacterized protein n=1 Tax=Solanum verrucosum TaxID=315347 RepID=A0AAF0QG68_SOLVR|nr:hypothetical protein MTR67_016527 [Solanum verrucosum]
MQTRNRANLAALERPFQDLPNDISNYS